MDEREKVLERVRNAHWLQTAGFVLLLLLSAVSIALPFFSGLARLEHGWVFNLGADIVGIAICTVLDYGCICGTDKGEKTTYLFVALLTLNAVTLFLDECAWLVQGVAGLRVWNVVVNVLFYLGGVLLLYQFWRYIRAALELDDRAAHGFTKALQVALIPASLLCFANFALPVYFSVDALGVYRRETLFPLSYAYALLCVIALFFGLKRSRASVRQKNVVISFVTLPILNAAITFSTFGISTQYIATLISVVLIYGVLFSERSRSLAATRTELQTATQIQEAMLPDVFPAFPDRADFDIFASMDPAREVGGDFYDFFLVDDDHLCMVMADVSGKGVPAALFMMASKIILANNAKMGKSPARILADTNASICANNREEMFVTVWLGVLELSTGKLTAANAGHEYPVLRQPGEEYEFFRDRHGIAVGAMDGVGYREYEMRLLPGARLFLYTDGVPEATNAEEEMFGTGRLLAARNEAGETSPEEMLRAVRRAVDGFVKDAEQFDDLTMLGLAYRGPQKECGPGPDGH